MTMLLAGDIGGTNTRLALYDVPPKTSQLSRQPPVREDVLSSRAFPSLEAAVRAFLGAHSPRIDAAAFGIAGPVVDGRVKTTNLPWQVDERAVSRRLRIPKVKIINDLVAIAFGAISAPRSKLVRLQGSSSPVTKKATVAVLAAGTGLGEAALVWDGARLVPCGSEGGHSDFGPRSGIEWDLFEFLSRRVKGRVSYERILSGPGLGNVYDFLREGKKRKESAAAAKVIAESADRNVAITTLGLSGESRVCKEALELFLGVYGAEAGNLALRFLATGGVFVAGGIAASLAPLLEKGSFLEAFRDKGRLRPLLEKVPVMVLLDSNIGLFGATQFAATL
jgi:glucokinase